MKGYYSLGLSGYEVDIIDQDHVRWLFVGTDREQIAHRAKVYYTGGGTLLQCQRQAHPPGSMPKDGYLKEGWRHEVHVSSHD